jgi:hypothetical protein
MVRKRTLAIITATALATVAMTPTMYPPGASVDLVADTARSEWRPRMAVSKLLVAPPPSMMVSN